MRNHKRLEEIRKRLDQIGPYDKSWNEQKCLIAYTDSQAQEIEGLNHRIQCLRDYLSKLISMSVDDAKMVAQMGIITDDDRAKRLSIRLEQESKSLDR